MAAGKFITFEGGEGAGKSTQADLLAERLNESGHETLLTREPGGSARAEEIRDFLLSGHARGYGSLGEALLFFAARDDHLEQTIRPALEAGRWVICDRFSDSTRAYQGAAGGVSPSVLTTLERIVVSDTKPDMTIILDLSPEEGLRRAAGVAGKDAETPDRFEGMDIGFHKALRQAFLDIAEAEPGRCLVLDAMEPASAVAESVWEAVVERLDP